MKQSLLRIAMITVMLFSVNLITKAAPITPNTVGVKLICSGGTYALPTPDPNTKWVVRFSATENDPMPAGVTLNADGKTITDALQTGYYYIYSQGTAANSCMSEATVVPFYVFKPLSVTLSGGTSYCVENAGSDDAKLTAVVNNTDDFTGLVYQWYTVTGGVEAAIPSATALTYKPTLATPGTTKYLFKAGYLVGTDKFCPAFQTQDVTVTTPPTKPVITITNSGVTTW